MRAYLFGEIVILLASQELLEHTLHSRLILLGQPVAIQLLEVLLGQMVDVHVEVSVLVLVVLGLAVVLGVHDLDALGSLHLLLHFFSVLSRLFDNWVAEVEV